jgi:hypothetical protein
MDELMDRTGYLVGSIVDRCWMMVGFGLLDHCEFEQK